jgi:hypothetical protein
MHAASGGESRIMESRMSVTDVIDRYCLVWSEPDAQRRAELLASVWSDRATYSDPTVPDLGAEELLAHIARVQATRPGARVLRSTEVDEHHGVARFGFVVQGADGTRLREGVDIAFLSATHTRIERVVGFFGALRPLAD